MKDSRYAIRAAENADIPEIKRIVFGVLEEFGLHGDESEKDADLNDIEASYFLNAGYFGVVTDVRKGTMVGTFGLFRLSDQVCELRKMYLLPEARGLGCGKLILDFVHGLAADMKYKTIRLETISVLKTAIHLYKKYGFLETSPREINDRVDQAYELNVSPFPS